MTHHDGRKGHEAQGRDASIPTAGAGEAVSHLGQDDADDANREKEKNQSHANPPPRQPGGIAPGDGPGASVGSIGTGGGQTGGAASGSVKKSGI